MVMVSTLLISRRGDVETVPTVLYQSPMAPIGGKKCSRLYPAAADMFSLFFCSGAVEWVDNTLIRHRGRCKVKGRSW